MCNDPNLDLVNINAYTNFVKFYHFVLKILSGDEILNEILISIKDHNSFTHMQKIMCYNPNQDFVNIIAYTKFGNSINLSEYENLMHGKQLGRMRDNPTPV